MTLHERMPLIRADRTVRISEDRYKSRMHTLEIIVDHEYGLEENGWSNDEQR